MKLIRHALASFLFLLVLPLGALAAADDYRVAAQALAGTSGFEPGVAFEWRTSGLDRVVVRPEVFVSEDGRPGAGGAVLYDTTTSLGLPSRQAFSFGPRAVFHNADDSGWEVDAMAIWSYELDRTGIDWRHTVGLIGALGVLKDRKHDQTDLGASGGAFYSYRF